MRFCHRSILQFASLLLFCSYTGFSQQLNFSLVSSPVETPWNLVTGMAQDKNGVMWFTTDNGLRRYDGYTITTYLNEPQNPNSPAQNSIENLYIDRDGIIWLGMFNSGLDRFDPATKSYTHYRHNTEDPASLVGDEVRAILEDSEGVLWVGTSQGLCRLDKKTGKFTEYKSIEDDRTTLSENRVKAIYEDRQGTLWIGTGETWGPTDFLKGGLNRFDRKTGKFTRFMHDPNDPNSLIDNRVRAICEDSRGNFWVGTAGDGLHLMDRDKGTFQRLSNDPKHPEKLSRPPLSSAPMPSAVDHITFIREDATGAIWIGTMGAGVNRFDPDTKKITHYGGDARPGGLMDEKTWWSNLSGDGVFWISCLQGNLYRVDPSQTQIPSFNSDPPLLLFQNKKHIIWEVTRSGLIQKDLRTGSKKLFNQDSFIAEFFTKIRCLAADREGVVWVGTTEGLHRYDSVSQSFTQYVHNPDDERSLPGNFVSAILEDQAGNLWVGTGTLSNLNRKTGYFTHYQNNPADSSSLHAAYFVSALMNDEDQNYLWVGSQGGGGINRLNKQSGKFEHYRRNDNVNAIVKDLEGIIWVATNAGLFKFNQKKNDFEKFKDPTGFIEVNYANSVIVDNQNNLWLYRSNGIMQIKNKGEQIVLYNRNNGVRVNTFVRDSKDLDGRLYYHYVPPGYYSFLPDSLPQQDSTPIIFIEDFRVASESLEHDGGRYLYGAANELTEINLSYDQSAFTFDFVPIHYSSPEDNRVVFKLENYDKDWRILGSEKKAQYFNVPPGHYTFRIKASTNMGIYTERAITVYLAPPWWRTWWAYAIYGILLIGGILMVDRIQRKRILSKAHEEAREKELEQAREIEKAYNQLKEAQKQLIQSEKMASLGELTAGIAHEIQNPLNFVNNFSEVSNELLDEMKADFEKGDTEEGFAIADNIKQNLEKILHHGKRADAIVKGMLQHSSSGSGNKEPTDINALADEYLRLAYHGLRAKDKSFNATMKTSFDQTIGNINIIPQDIGRVILNLITNAFYAVNARLNESFGQEKSKQNISGYEPTVEVSTKKDGNKVLISVKDNGNGIPQKILDKIFQPFFTTKPTGQGTGLGLSLSYDIVKAHGGEIRVESEEGKGTQFTIQIPLS